MAGWKTSIVNCRKFEELPDAAQKYIQKIEQLLGKYVLLQIANLQLLRDGVLSSAKCSGIKGLLIGMPI